VSDTGKSLEFALAAGVFPGGQDLGAAAIGDAGGHDGIVPGGPVVTCSERFGRHHDLRHTVRVALSQVRAWRGIRPAPTRARPVPTVERDQFRSRTRLREGDTPDRGGRWTKTGKQRRNNRAHGLIGQIDHGIGARQETGSRPGE
jgi:hypothetical protein